MATFTRWEQCVKPVEPPPCARTQEIRMMSRSLPWKPSTVPAHGDMVFKYVSLAASNYLLTWGFSLAANNYLLTWG